ncbi:hypothetical protein DH2020_026456 [Rehmannia glutinosa]|uniref:Uncharacterized protein n=1 Tax=Rehmannia glutinosa TaxID=99300 RepID=A0ABR0W0V8_REHGL
MYRDPELVKRIGAATALEVRATGIPYTFAPCIAVLNLDSLIGIQIIKYFASYSIFFYHTQVCRDPRWGRCYESYSEDPKVVRAMTEIVSGLQGDIPANSRKGVPFLAGQKNVLASAKHFVGDGGTTKGRNENNTVASWHGLLSIHMPAYHDSIIKGVGTVMVSYSSWNGVKMHANRDLITGYLKNTLRFRIMVPYKYAEFIDGLTSLVKNKFIPMSRIDDAVTRILRVKFTMGLFEHPLADYSMIKHLGRTRRTGKRSSTKVPCVAKNGESADKPLLPLPKKASKILVAGTHANNIGNQCGGYTVQWQGQPGNVTIGTTILTGIKKTVHPQTEVVFSENPDSGYVKSNKFSHAIVVVGEPPYSETFGDNTNLTLPDPGPSIITNVCASVKCVVVLITGRPVVIQPYLAQIDALVAAWLPGTEGQGVADVLFGDYGFIGKLSRTWFKTVDQLPMNVGDKHYDPLFPFGFGLTTKPVKANQI